MKPAYLRTNRMPLGCRLSYQHRRKLCRNITGPHSDSQETRGVRYQQVLQSVLLARAPGEQVFPFIGIKWWELYDSSKEVANWGLITRLGAMSVVCPPPPPLTRLSLVDHSLGAVSVVCPLAPLLTRLLLPEQDVLTLAWVQRLVL
jgi:hypothetical protein